MLLIKIVYFGFSYFMDRSLAVFQPAFGSFAQTTVKKAGMKSSYILTIEKIGNTSLQS